MKAYINPEIKVVRLVHKYTMMAGSDIAKGEEFNSSTDVVLSRRGDSFWEDDEE